MKMKERERKWESGKRRRMIMLSFKEEQWSGILDPTMEDFLSIVISEGKLINQREKERERREELFKICVEL